MITIPTMRKMSDAERFVWGLRQLAKETNMKSWVSNNVTKTVVSFQFNDGSEAIAVDAMREIIG